MACRGLGFVGQSRSRIALLCEEGALTGQRRAGWACLGLPGSGWMSPSLGRGVFAGLVSITTRCFH